jgi:hypothetical protein
MSMMWKEILQQGALNVKQYTWKVGKKFHSETNVPVVCGYESKILSYFQLFVLPHSMVLYGMWLYLLAPIMPKLTL